MINVIKDFLINPIVVNWIAPVITGIILLGITGLIKIIINSRDKKRVKIANDRFVNSIRPYIIQNISINNSFIDDVRKAIIRENNIKERFMFNNFELRNKIIFDITESNYINESDKKKLIDFTYNVFGKINVDNIDNKTEEYRKSIYKSRITLFIFIISFFTCLIIQLVEKENLNISTNHIYSLSYMIAFVSCILLLLNYFTSIMNSKVSDKSLKDKVFDFIFEYEEIPLKNKKKNK